MGKRLGVRKMRSSARGCLELGVCFSTRIRTLEYNRTLQYPGPSGTEYYCLDSDLPVGSVERSRGEFLTEARCLIYSGTSFSYYSFAMRYVLPAANREIQIKATRILNEAIASAASRVRLSSIVNCNPPQSQLHAFPYLSFLYP
jgi:hypothetical protein